MSNRAATRQHLVDMCERLISNLDARIEGGNLTLLAAVNGALSAIDAERGTDAPAAARAIVTDVPGQPIALSLYGEEGRAAIIVLSPARAIAVAGQLLDAALRRLPR